MKNSFFLKVFSIICSVIIIISLMSIKNFAATTYVVKGYAIDEEGNRVSNVNVVLNGSNTYNAQTDENGFYQINDVAKGNYKLTFDYDSMKNSYNIKDIISKEYEEYDQKLEVGFIYNSAEKQQSEIEELNKQIESIVTGKYRSFENTYDSGSKLQLNLKNLEKDSSNDTAFHKIGMKYWKSIAVVIANISKDQVQNYFSHHVTSNTALYKFVVKNKNATNDEIFDELYKILKEKDPTEESIYDESSSVDGKAVTKQIEVDKQKSINGIFIKEAEPEPEPEPEPEEPGGEVPDDPGDISTLPLDNGNSDFIQGYIRKADGTPVKDGVKVFIVDENDPSKKTSTSPNDDGWFSLGYPDEGTYRVAYQFSDSQINGQYYKVVSDYTNINSCTDINKNVILQTNLKKIKEYFATIGKEQEMNQLENQNGKCTLIGASDTFYVEASYEVYYDSDGDGVDDSSYTVYPTPDKLGTGIIEERSKFSLTVDEEINNMVVTLSNGQNIVNWDKDNGEEYGAHVMAPSGSKTKQIILTDDLRYGSTLYLGYKITVTNNSGIDCDGFTLLSHYVGFDFNPAERNKETSVINENEGWIKLTKDEAKAWSNNLDLPSDKYLQYQTNEKLKAGESRDIYLSFSIVLSNQEDFEYYNVTELVEYKNSEGRRNYDRDENIIRAGNFDYINIGYSRQEKDDDFSGAVSVIPPFGIDTSNKYFIIINISTLFLLVFIITKLKNKKVGRRK